MSDPIAAFPLDCHSMWLTPSFNVERIEAYGHLRTFISRDHFRSRIATIHYALVRGHPFPWFEFTTVTASVLLMMLIVAMSIAVGLVHAFAGAFVAIPAVVLVLPVVGSFVLLKRLKVRENERIDMLGPMLSDLLNEFNRNDISTYEIKWVVLKRSPIQSQHDYVIHIRQADSEVEVEALPAYEGSTHDAVILIGDGQDPTSPVDPGGLPIRSPTAIPPKYNDAIELKTIGNGKLKSEGPLDVTEDGHGAGAGTSRFDVRITIDDDDDDDYGGGSAGAGTSGRADIPIIVVVPPTHPPMVEVGDYDRFYENDGFLRVPAPKSRLRRVEDPAPYAAAGRVQAIGPEHGEAPPDYEMAVADGDGGRLEVGRVRDV
ncbi:hypothetical protein BC938DRAFT_480260 [Jimgerdemannia flammicorona]|uniref:Uncharacterized protein n=1 Tax=Jimgerdemannia flammicorona TaxID=994334 RepID=A0A433QXC5_9FUNG|nr:hypothetical protein BC938DRAFT_480260 [Jimgerdemannia flammicorona]